MTVDKTQSPPSTPNFLKAIKTGFDATSNHIHLILFPIALDLLLWLGPHLRLTQLIRSIVDQLLSFQGVTDAAAQDLMKAGQEMWLLLADRFNLLSALRSYPIGIPSLMTSRLPIEIPGGSPVMWELHSVWSVLGIWVLLSLLGLILGTLYFTTVTQAAISGEVHWGQALRQWPQLAFRVVLLALFWVGLLGILAFPMACITSIAAVGGFAMIQCAMLIYGGFALWLIFPLLLSSQGVFVNQLKVFASIKASSQLTRLTFSSTALFFLSVILLSKGLDMLWQVPPENSWLTLIGVVGHAFITTGLLAASFVYYRDADHWTQEVLRQLKTNATKV